MRGYKIVRDGKGYRFVLIPNNNNGQPIGQSCLYKSEKECRKGLADFASLVKCEQINKEIPDRLTIKKNDDNTYRYEYMIESNPVFYRPNGYYAKANCKKIIKSIYNKIDDYSTNEII